MRDLVKFFQRRFSPFRFSSAVAGAPGAMLLSDDMEVQRRRKGGGPEGRADAPVRRDQGRGGEILAPAVVGSPQVTVK